MPVFGFTRFERFFLAAGSVDVDRDDMKRFLDFVNEIIYDLLIRGQANAEANGRDIIQPGICPSQRACRRRCISSASSTRT